MKAILEVGYRCNQRCVFCHRLELRERDVGAVGPTCSGVLHTPQPPRQTQSSGRQVRARIARARDLGHSMVVLSGGEPTIRPELRGWAGYVAALGMDLGLITNGQMLAYPDLVDALIAHRLRYVHMSLHGGSAEVHDRMTASQGFVHSRAALANLHGRGLELVVNAVVTRDNLDHLGELVDSMRDYPDTVLKFSLVEPRGGGERHFDRLTPSVVEAGDAVARALASDPDRASRGGFAHDGIPLCRLPGWEELYADLESAGFTTMIEVGDRDFFAVDDRARVRPERCGDCRWRGRCPGLYRGYLERRGDQELRPAPGGARSNSFHYVRLGQLAAPADRGCPLLGGAGVTPWSAERDLLVREDGAVVRYRTATRDFAGDQLWAIKHRLGQVYLDRSSKPAVDDFAADLALLTRVEWCDECPERARCTGIHEAARDRPFERDRVAVDDLLAGLTGALLDVGCGDGRYLAPLMTRVATGQLSYVGIDPDPTRLDRLRRRWPTAVLHALPAERSSELGGPFDHIVLLRSWNHLADVDRVLSAVAGLLAGDGTLTVVDDVPFGLARSPEQAERGETGPATFEHRRNDDAEAAAQRIGASSLAAHLSLVERKDVTPATSNQWLLHYRRRSGA